MTVRRKISTALASLAALVLMMLGAGMGPAGADTADCASSVQTHNGITANYCASQAIAAAGLELSVPNKAGAFARLTFKRTSTGNPQQDFEYFNPPAHPDNQKIVEYAPHGDPTNLCMAVSNSGRLPVLKPCNLTAAAQQWVFEGPDPSGGYAIVSEANGKAVSDPTGAAFARAVLVSVGGSSFTYVQ